MSGGIGLPYGDKITVKDAMHCVMLPSSNNAAAAAACAVLGSQKRFRKLMLKKAKSIGATETTYKYAFGDWHSKTHSTAFDQALIGRELMTNKKTRYLRKVMKKKRYSFRTKVKKRAFTVSYSPAGNLLVGKYGSLGIKTGYNPPAGRCFTNAWKYRGHLYVSVVLKESSKKDLWNDVKKLTKFTNYMTRIKAGKVVVKKSVLN